MYPRPICPRTFVNEIVGLRAAVRREEDARATRISERTTAWPKSCSQPSPRARRRLNENGMAHADQEHERRLNQVPEDAAAPLHVVELLEQELERNRPARLHSEPARRPKVAMPPEAIASITKPR